MSAGPLIGSRNKAGAESRPLHTRRVLGRTLGKAERAWCGLAVLYVFLSLIMPRLPGVYYDEVILVNPSWEVLSGHFPLAGNVAYVGALKAYLHAPFVWAFGSSVLALRAVGVLVSCITLWLIYRLAATMFGDARAGIASRRPVRLPPGSDVFHSNG